MGAIVLPDWGAQAGEALAKLGSGLADIVNPNRKFHEAIRQAVSTNPEIIQKLADLTLTNTFLPAAYTRMLPRDVLDAVFSTEPTPEAYKQKAAMDRAAQLTNDQRLALGTSRLTGQTATEGALDLVRAPEVPRVAGQAPGTIPTTLAEQGAQRAVGGMTAGQAAADMITAQLGPGAQEFMGVMKQHDAEHGTDFYNRMAAEHFSLLNEEQNRMSMADRILLLNMHQQDRIDTIQMHEADSRYNKSGGMGSPELWRALLYDPKTQRRLEEIRATGPKTSDDRDLIRMESYRRSAGELQERASYMSSVVTRDGLLDNINGNPAKKILPDDDTKRPGDIAAINAELVFEHTPFEAYWGTSPDGSGGTKLRFRSRAHKQIEVQPDQVFRGFQQADRAFSGEGLDVVQPKPEGAAGAKPKPPAQVTGGPPAGVRPQAPPAQPAINPDTLSLAKLWEYLRLQNPNAPDSVITNMVRARRNVP